MCNFVSRCTLVHRMTYTIRFSGNARHVLSNVGSQPASGSGQSVADNLHTMFTGSRNRTTTGTEFNPYNRLGRMASGRPSDRRSVRQPMKQSRPRPGRVRSVRVVYVKVRRLPHQFSKRLVLLDGIVDIVSSESEETIRQHLCDVLHVGPTHQGVVARDLQFLSCSNKELYAPTMATDQEWTGGRVLALIGQGKLYVRVQMDSGVQVRHYTDMII
jgi:hypothetical protein